MALLAFGNRRSHANEQDFAHEGGGGSQEWLDAFRQLFARGLEALLHQKAVFLRVGIPIELGVDKRERDIGIRPQAGQTCDAHECRLDRLRDAGFHFLGSQSRSFGKNDNGRLSKVRKHFHGQAECRENPKHQNEG